MLRYSISMLLCLMVLIGIACTALMHPTQIWDQATFTATLLVILVAIVMAIINNAPRRNFFIGFAIFAGVYVLHTSNGLWWYGQTSRLLTESANNLLQASMHPELPPYPTPPVAFSEPDPNSQIAMYFHNICHSMWALTLGVAGGMFAHVVGHRAAKRRETESR